MSDRHRPPEHLSDRLKRLPNELENLQLEQVRPNKPNFLLVVILAGVAVIILFVVAIFVLHLDGGKLFKHLQKNPTSQLVLPTQAKPIAIQRTRELPFSGSASSSC